MTHAFSLWSQVQPVNVVTHSRNQPSKVCQVFPIWVTHLVINDAYYKLGVQTFRFFCHSLPSLSPQHSCRYADHPERKGWIDRWSKQKQINRWNRREPTCTPTVRIGSRVAVYFCFLLFSARTTLSSSPVTAWAFQRFREVPSLRATWILFKRACSLVTISS